MNLKRAMENNMKCGACNGPLCRVQGKQYGCVNPNCFQEYYQVAYRIRLGLLAKNRL